MWPTEGGNGKPFQNSFQENPTNSMTRQKGMTPDEPPMLEGVQYATGEVSSVQFSRSVVSDSLRPHESQHARPPCPSPTPGVHPDSRPSSQ